MNNLFEEENEDNMFDMVRDIKQKNTVVDPRSFADSKPVFF